MPNISRPSQRASHEFCGTLPERSCPKLDDSRKWKQAATMPACCKSSWKKVTGSLWTSCTCPGIKSSSGTETELIWLAFVTFVGLLDAFLEGIGCMCIEPIHHGNCHGKNCSLGPCHLVWSAFNLWWVKWPSEFTCQIRQSCLVDVEARTR